jgi:hypothetical protein
LVKFDETEEGDDKTKNPGYAEEILNLLQNVPFFLIDIINMRLLGDSYAGLIGYLI